MGPEIGGNFDMAGLGRGPAFLTLAFLPMELKKPVVFVAEFGESKFWFVKLATAVLMGPG